MANVQKLCNDVYEHYLQFIEENKPSKVEQAMNLYSNVLSANYTVEQYLDLSRKMFRTENIYTDSKDDAKKSFTSMCIIHSSTFLDQLRNDELYKLGSNGLSPIFAFITGSYARSYFSKKELNYAHIAFIHEFVTSRDYNSYNSKTKDMLWLEVCHVIKELKKAEKKVVV